MAAEERKRRSEAEVDLLLSASLLLAGSPAWDGSDQNLCADMPVQNRQDQYVRLNVRIVLAIPWRYHLVLRWDKVEMRKLDVRDDHSNPDGSEHWRLRTHKHRFTDEWGHRFAYTPTELPDTTQFRVDLDEYEEVFFGFCHECMIDTTDFTWIDPPLRPRPTTL